MEPRAGPGKVRGVTSCTRLRLERRTRVVVSAHDAPTLRSATELRARNVHVHFRRGAMADDNWQDLGPVAGLAGKPLQQVKVGRTAIALTYRDGQWSAISGICNHVGGPLGD